MKSYNDWDTKTVPISSGSVVTYYDSGVTLSWTAFPAIQDFEFIEDPNIESEEPDPSSIHFAEEKVTKFEKLKTSRKLRDEFWYEFKCQLKI